MENGMGLSQSNIAVLGAILATGVASLFFPLSAAAAGGFQSEVRSCAFNAGFAATLLGGEPTRIEIAAGQFSFILPPALAEVVPGGPSDTLVKQYESATLKLSFDYGPYSDPLKLAVDGALDYQVQETVIDGKPARLVTYHRDAGTGGNGPAYPYFAGVYFPDLGRGSRFKLGMYATGATLNDQQLSLQIMRSVQFQ
jgi:hypothetical protein